LTDTYEISDVLPEPEPSDVRPILLYRVFDAPARVLDLVERHGPYWNQSRYQPVGQRAAAAATPAGHPYAMAGGSPPLFRGNWADSSMAAEGVGPLLASPVLHAAARSLFAGRVTATSFLYVNITAPMPGIDAGHVDVPSFRGLDRRTVPGWFLLAMRRSGLFTRWAIRTATAVVWFYAGAGGALSYWPEGPAGPRRSVSPTSNTAIIGDNDRMLHGWRRSATPAAGALYRGTPCCTMWAGTAGGCVTTTRRSRPTGPPNYGSACPGRPRSTSTTLTADAGSDTSTT
jgi:hypothetical protein